MPFDLSNSSLIILTFNATGNLLTKSWNNHKTNKEFIPKLSVLSMLHHVWCNKYCMDRAGTHRNRLFCVITKLLTQRCPWLPLAITQSSVYCIHVWVHVISGLSSDTYKSWSKQNPHDNVTQHKGQGCGQEQCKMLQGSYQPLWPGITNPL